MTFKQHINNHRIGDIKTDLIMTAFLYECEQRGNKWPEVKVYKPEFKPFWDHEYSLKTYIDALEAQMQATAIEHYYEQKNKVNHDA